MTSTGEPLRAGSVGMCIRRRSPARNRLRGWDLKPEHQAHRHRIHHPRGPPSRHPAESNGNEANPPSSMMRTRRFGAVSGGDVCPIGGNSVSGSLASNVMRPGCGMSGIGRTPQPCNPSVIFDTSLVPTWLRRRDRCGIRTCRCRPGGACGQPIFIPRIRTLRHLRRVHWLVQPSGCMTRGR